MSNLFFSHFFFISIIKMKKLTWTNPYFCISFLLQTKVIQLNRIKKLQMCQKLTLIIQAWNFCLLVQLFCMPIVVWTKTLHSISLNMCNHILSHFVSSYMNNWMNSNFVKGLHSTMCYQFKFLINDLYICIQ